MQNTTLQPDYQTAIIGAGFAGIIAALGLRKSGRSSFIIFEKAAQPGGTWRDNTYPGCACDIPTQLYAIDSVPNPDWSRRFAHQPEIWAYMNRVIEQHDLTRHIRYHSKIVRYEFLEEHGFWRLTDHLGHSCTARVVILATGPFHKPKLPTIDGIDVFGGKIMHSARWDHHYSLKGKRVAVVGTGASAIQIVPAIAPEVAQLTVFQRTPAWVADRFDREIAPFWKKAFRNFPGLQRFIRRALFELLELRGKLFWGNETLYEFFKNQCLKKLEREVTDPETRQKLTPAYRMGCKRIAVSDDYLPTFNRPNVQLVTDPVSTFTPAGVRTQSGAEYPLDAIVFATGFEVTEYDSDVKIIGREGRDLFETWNREGAETFRGTFIAGFPNFCTLLGPNTGLGHNSVLLMMEIQMKYVLQFLAHLERQSGDFWLEPKREVQIKHIAEVQHKLQRAAWAAGCSSWYLDARGKNTTVYPGLVKDFDREMRHFHPEEFAAMSVRFFELA